MHTPTYTSSKNSKILAALVTICLWLFLTGNALALSSQTYYGLFNGTVDKAVETSTGYSLLTEAIYGKDPAYSYGLYWDSSDAVIESEKSIDVVARWESNRLKIVTETVESQEAISRVHGLFIEDDTPLFNSGDISVTAEGGSVSATDRSTYALLETRTHGISSHGETNNSGNITVVTIGGTATTNESYPAYSYSSAYGINHSISLSRSEVSNSGDISVTSNGGKAKDTNTVSANTTAVSDASGIAAIDTVNNDGNISVAANGGIATSSSDANSYGYATNSADSRSNSNVTGISSFSNVSNNGNITAIANGGKSTSSSNATAHVNAEDKPNNYSNTYTYARTKTASRANANANGIISSLVTINSGNITVTANGGKTTSSSDVYASRDDHTNTSATSLSDSYANATTYGISSYGTISLDGNIMVTANGGTVVNQSKSYATADSKSYATADSKSYATADSNSSAIAFAGGINSRGPVNNTSNITVIANGGTATSISTAHAVTATTISGNADTNAYAYGIFSYDTISNYGNIMVTANGGTATAPNAANAYANARGIIASRSTGRGRNTTIYNRGNIMVTANSGTASSLTNNYTNSDTHALGIYLNGNNLFLTNYGSISAFADTAYEIYIDGLSDVSLVDNYTLTIDGATDKGSIYVASSSSLDLNNAKLSVTTGSDFSWDTDYRLFDNDGTINGSFSSVSSLNPDVSVSYNNRGTSTDSSDDTVSLIYAPQESAVLSAIQATSSTINTANGQIDHRLLSTFLASNERPKRRLYASSGMIMSDAKPQPLPKRQWFLTQYYANGSQSDANYNSDSLGLVGGFQNIMGQQLYGAHFGYSRSSVDFNNSKKTDINQDSLLAGVHALSHRGNITLRGQLSAYYTWLDYNALTGAGYTLTEKADYNSYGITSKLLVGYLLKNRNQQWLPEIGFDYLWLHQQDFSTRAEGSSWDIAIGDMDEHQISAVANLNWQTHQPVQNLIMTPKLNAGIRYLLTDNEQSISQQVSGSAPVSLTNEQDRLITTLGVALQLQRNQQSVELAYNGQFSEDNRTNSFWLKFTGYF